MKLRIFTEPQQGADYQTLRNMALAAEELGFDAFFRSDHYLAMGDTPGLPGPTDSWATLAGLAVETSRIRLGTLMTAATFRLPGPLAITVAQVDQMSGGRVEFGLGSGWYEAEHSAYGIPFPAVGERFDRLEEQFAIITGLWGTPEGESFSFAGTYYQLTDSPGLPKPAQRPRPPVLIGGSGPRRTPQLAARFADEFNVPFLSVQESAAIFDRVPRSLRGCRALPLVHDLLGRPYDVLRERRGRIPPPRRGHRVGSRRPEGKGTGRDARRGRGQDRQVRGDRGGAHLPAGARLG